MINFSYPERSGHGPVDHLQVSGIMVRAVRTYTRVHAAGLVPPPTKSASSTKAREETGELRYDLAPDEEGPKTTRSGRNPVG